MFKNSFFFFFLLHFFFLFGQTKKSFLPNDELLVLPIFDEKFNEIPNAHKIAEKLVKKDLNTLVFEGVIHRYDMLGFALPLGVHNSMQTDSVNLSKGMCAMWQSKIKFAQKNHQSLFVPNEIALTSYYFIDKTFHTPNHQTNLEFYRKQIIEKAVNNTKEIYRRRLLTLPPSDSEKRKFMNMFMDILSPNILLAYNIQEILPPTHLVDNQVYDINPFFKIHYFDQLLQKGGYVFIEGFPARYDTLLSFGPFQMTDISLKGIAENVRVFDEFKVYKSMKDLISIEDHAKAATYFAYCNWDYLASSLEAENLLKSFNDYFAGYQNNEEKFEKLKILVAGLTACMHHSSSNTRRMLRETIQNNQFENIHYQILQAPSSTKQLRKYYRSSAEAYLMLKNYQELKEMYLK